MDQCLDLLGPVMVSDSTRKSLVNFAARQGDLNLTDHQTGDDAEQRVATMLGLATSTREFQLA